MCICYVIRHMAIEHSCHARLAIGFSKLPAAVWRGSCTVSFSPVAGLRERMEREKSMMYRTVLEQNRQGISWTV